MNQISPLDRFDRVWDSIAETTEEAASLLLRSELMDKIRALIDSKGWTQAKVVIRCGVTQSRTNDLFRGRLSRFSLDAGEHRSEVGAAGICEAKSSLVGSGF